MWPRYPLQKGYLLPAGSGLQGISSRVFGGLTTLLTGQCIPKTVSGTITDLCCGLIHLIPAMDEDEKGIKALLSGKENRSCF